MCTDNIKPDDRHEFEQTSGQKLNNKRDKSLL